MDESEYIMIPEIISAIIFIKKYSKCLHLNLLNFRQIVFSPQKYSTVYFLINNCHRNLCYLHYGGSTINLLSIAMACTS